MSYTFTRRRYDQEELAQFDQSNKRGNTLIMDLNSKENKNGCNNSFGTGQGAGNISRPLNQEGFLDFQKKTDIENKLRNTHIELNSARRNNMDYKEVPVKDMDVCSAAEHLVNEDSRFNFPINQFREMSTTELAFTPYLHMNPQSVHAQNQKFMEPIGRMGTSTRYDNKKDLFKKSMKEYKETVQDKPKNYDPNDLLNLLPKNSKPTWWGDENN
jgi:hypothetical protein